MGEVQLLPPEERPSVVVLQSVSAPSRGIDFVSELERHATVETCFRYFSWPRALLTDYDVLHMHWPEYWIRNSNVWKRSAQYALFPLLLVRLRLRRAAVVRTMHNVAPHEGGSRLESLYLQWLDRVTTLRIKLNPSTIAPDGAAFATIPHGDFRAFAELVVPNTARVGGRILFFGHIREYKAVPELLRAFSAISDPALSLHVAGGVKGAGLRAQIESLASSDERIATTLAFVEDRDLAREVVQSTLVALPYSEMNNSGAVFVALSLGRPVLVPRSAATDDLAKEVGEQWVIRFDGPLDREVLERATSAAQDLLGSSSDAPRLHERDWARLDELHYRAYVAALALVRPPRKESS
ncbi:GDP-mannose:glycolipid 4-beta-D-mannosyltransferase [Microbacterium lemovicicum]|uniref:GDP-mannose:glycolipid 4-beta-D-mannosyltransferase n=1 Tax=Microbacterium lemovicicum TaxID=1072463 RepID=A0A3Q9IWF1_9MICO|nr:glycosyltransferase [Microbacterium lemovicicum]AZS35898.1 GDP-mannose:glycolipid 4-beta-D-mannosyltransferase [Microbacterium lemovicicum]